MERINELETKIVNEYIDRLIENVNELLENLNNAIVISKVPKGTVKTIINYLRPKLDYTEINKDLEELMLVIASNGKSLRDELIPIIKETAINEFLEKMK